MTNDQITELRGLLAEVSDHLKDCKTHVRGISAYRSDADGFTFAVTKFQTAAGKLHRVAEELNTLAAGLSPVSTSATAANADNGREIEALA
jgi:hypothetical protein